MKKSKRGSVAPQLARGSKSPLGELIEDFRWTVDYRDSSLLSRQKLNHNTRFCIWPNQSEDGRKWKPRRSEDEVFPWPGASDARVPLIDKYIREDKAALMVIWQRMRTVVSGTESNDAAWASRLTSFLRWMKYTQMTEARTENSLLADYVLSRGAGLMEITWCKQMQLGYDELDLETLMKFAVMESQRPDANELIVQLPVNVLDASRTTEAAQGLALLYSDVKPARLQRIISDLRAEGFARFPRPYEVKNRPKLLALAPNEEAFISPDATGVDDAAAIYRVELLRKERLQERVHSYDWSPEWVEKMLSTQKGMTSAGQIAMEAINSRQRQISGRGLLANEKLFEVIHAYRIMADDEGVPGIFYTCFNPNLPELPAYHELLDYDHGQLPFVLVEREKLSRRLDASRGYGEVGNTWQGQIKSEWDGRIDRASIATLPPSYYPDGQQPDKWGPGVQVPTHRPEQYGFFSPPKYDIGSKEAEESVRKFADEYFGRPVDEQNTVQSQNLLQELADNWMAGQAQIDTQILQLCQQYMPDNFYFRVVGSSQGKPIHATREEIQGKFDVTVTFNVADMDPEYVKEKLGLIEKALMMDVNGIVDRNEALVATFELLDPNMGERLLKPAESAAQAEVEDEQTIFVKLLAGIPVDVKPGQAYQLRLQVLGQLLQQSQEAQRKMQTDESVKLAIEKRFKQLQHQLQQRENARIGVLGG